MSRKITSLINQELHRQFIIVARNDNSCENQRMVDKLDTLAERLKFLRKKSGLSLAAVGKQLGVTPQAVHKWENGGSVDDTRQWDLAGLFQVSPSWLIWGEETSQIDTLFNIPHDPTSGFPSKPKVPEDGLFVPLLSADKVLSWIDGPALFDFHSGEWLPCPAPHGGSTFALRVQGESMERLGGRISYSDGDIIFVDPDRPHQSGSRVVVTWGPIDESPTTLFRQLIVEGGVYYQRPLNPGWPDQITKLYENRIVGTVIGKWVAE